MKTKNLLMSLLILASAGFWGSCEKKEEGKASIKFQAVNHPGVIMKSTPFPGVVINTFKVNIDEIEFEFYDSPDDQYPDGETYAELELAGPFEVDLVKNGNTQLTDLAANVTLPQTGFDEIEFEFELSENGISELFGKSILVKGTINGTPFIYFSTIDEFEIEKEFVTPVSLFDARDFTVTVSINLAAIFNPAMGGVDITDATDGNGNGTIEIYLLDNDGNNALADKIDNAIWKAIDAIEETFDN